MKILKIYLDTSVISHLSAEDTPDKMAETLQLWDAFKIGKYQAVISGVTTEELLKCPDPKRTELMAFLQQINYEFIEETEESLDLTASYMLYGVLPEKSRVDCRHIAVATVCNCHYIVSWNFKHFVNIKTINKVQAVNKMLNYAEISIIPPPMLLEGDESDE